MSLPITTACAETLALKALGFLANSPSGLDRFLAGTGANIVILRERADDPQMLAAVLDFLLSDEALARDFCESEALAPQTLHLMRRALPGAQSDG